MVLIVTKEHIKRFLKIIPNPAWIESKIKTGEVIVESVETRKLRQKNQSPLRPSLMDILYLCQFFQTDEIQSLIDDGDFIVDGYPEIGKHAKTNRISKPRGGNSVKGKTSVCDSSPTEK
jgi:hypothetical protein